MVSENENMSNLNAEWYINDKPYQTYAAGTLANTGGTVRFSKSGAYSVKALVTDEYGKEYTFASEPITIYPSQSSKSVVRKLGYLMIGISLALLISLCFSPYTTIMVLGIFIVLILSILLPNFRYLRK